MGFVIDGFLVVGLILLGVWLWSLRGSTVQDAASAQEQARQAADAHQCAVRDARMARPGEPLRCLGCNHAFLGPIAETGCPSCHLSALVVPESEAPSEASISLSPKEH